MHFIIVLILLAYTTLENKIKKLEDALNSNKLKVTIGYVLYLKNNLEINLCYFSKDTGVPTIRLTKDSTDNTNQIYRLDLSSLTKGTVRYKLEPDNLKHYENVLSDFYPKKAGLFVKELYKIKYDVHISDRMNNSISNPVKIDFSKKQITFVIEEFGGVTTPTFFLGLAVSLEDATFGKILSYDQYKLDSSDDRLSLYYSFRREDGGLEDIEKFTEYYIKHLKETTKKIRLIICLVFGAVVVLVILLVIYKYNLSKYLKLKIQKIRAK